MSSKLVARHPCGHATCLPGKGMAGLALACLCVALCFSPGFTDDSNALSSEFSKEVGTAWPAAPQAWQTAASPVRAGELRACAGDEEFDDGDDEDEDANPGPDPCYVAPSRQPPQSPLTTCPAGVGPLAPPDAAGRPTLRTAPDNPPTACPALESSVQILC